LSDTSGKSVFDYNLWFPDWKGKGPHGISADPGFVGLRVKGDISFSFDSFNIIVCRHYYAVMAETSRAPVGGICYHVMNRGNGRAEDWPFSSLGFWQSCFSAETSPGLAGGHGIRR